ncbi:MAG TPA: hypothetical protein PKM27_11115 [Saprospiraceae bacterium]|nr:hypothetical protein [Saprospiraceae bacterium]
MRLVICFFFLVWKLQLIALPGTADTTGISIIYTGRSLGALGVMRSQEEHELVTEQANTEHKPFKLVSHSCWRAPGLAVFLPSDEPRGNELPRILAQKDSAKALKKYPAFKTHNSLLVQDPLRRNPDMLDMMKKNPRQKTDIPDLAETQVTYYSMTIRNGDPAIIIEEEGAVWPEHPDLWTIGEVNRMDIGDTGRLYELPFNLGEMAVRSTVIKKQWVNADQNGEYQILADLGHRTGNFGLDDLERARIDFSLLTKLGYSILVPYHFELSLGADSLKRLSLDFPGIRLLATNIRSRDSSLFHSRLILPFGNIRVGLLGLVDPTLQGDLSKNSLKDFQFLPYLETIRYEVNQMRKSGVEAIVVLSNLDAGDNAALAEKVAGIDAIVADLHSRLSPETVIQSVELPGHNLNRPGSPALVTRSFADGLGVGRLRMKFDAEGRLLGLQHRLDPVTDQTVPDTSVIRQILSLSQRVSKPKGDLLFPAFNDLVTLYPDLKKYDATTQQGRVSQRMWEEFVARLLRNAGPTELAVIRKFPYFPPLIGKLHEREVSAWLWNEDEILFCDVKGSALLKILADDVHEDLIFSGLTRPKPGPQQTYSRGLPSVSMEWLQLNCRILGRPVDPDGFYRVATTDVIFEGVRAADFLESRRVRRQFIMDKEGRLVESPEGDKLSLRSFVLNELKRLNKNNKGDKFLQAVTERLKPDPRFEPLLSFDFDRPTLWTSYNRKYNSDGYGAVPESRITATNSWVIGASGRFKATMDGLKNALDLGLTLAYAKQNSEISKNIQQISESADDIKLDLTYRRKSNRIFQPFVRGQYDTEFTPTINPATLEENYKQQALRGVIGLARRFHRNWRNVELASVLEQDFGQNKAQFGFTARADGRFFLGGGAVIYSLRNDATWFFKAKSDTNRDLALRYNMVHELLIPLIDELSLSVASDFFFFKGKVEETRETGMSMLLRVGITYDRLWKPRYQPLF